MATEKIKTRIADALLALIAERRFGEIGLGDIAARAEISLAALREAYSGRLAILADFVRRIDRDVLAVEDKAGDANAESPRDRLFAVLMRRFDALAPHRPAMRNLRHAARRDPALALALNGIAVESATWMLAAAAINSAGLRGLIRAQGLAAAYFRVAETWLDDDDPGLGKTMAELDRVLKQGEQWLDRLDRFAGLGRRAADLRHRRRDDTDSSSS